MTMRRRTTTPRTSAHQQQGSENTREHSVTGEHREGCERRVPRGAWAACEDRAVRGHGLARGHRAARAYQEARELREARGHRKVRRRKIRERLSFRRGLMAVASAAIAVAALAGCAAGGGSSAAPSPSGPAAGESTGVAGVTVIDPWVKAADGDMTGMFGTIVNDTAEDITITSIEVPGAGSAEMHETVVGSDGSSTMQEIQGGFTVPAGGQLELVPGGDHIMLMALEGPIAPGDELTARLTLDSGEVMTITATAKEYAGAQESYAPGHGEPGHGSHGDGGHDHGGHGNDGHGDSGHGGGSDDGQGDDGEHTPGS